MNQNLNPKTTIAVLIIVLAAIGFVYYRLLTRQTTPSPSAGDVRPAGGMAGGGGGGGMSVGGSPEKRQAAARGSKSSPSPTPNAPKPAQP